MAQLSHPYMTTGKTIALTRWNFVGKVMSLLIKMLSKFVIAFLPRSKCLNFMVAVTIHSDFGAQEKSLSLFPFFLPSICHEGSKITADDDYSHEIKRRLLLGRKAMTNLDSILKSRDITLPTIVGIVKAMVFPVVMYGCESWAIKKAVR